jgi:hypothetical protein
MDKVPKGVAVEGVTRSPAAASETRADRLQTFEQVSGVIGNHRVLLRWCVDYAEERGRDGLSLQDVPDEIFAFMTSSQEAMTEALLVLYTCTMAPGAWVPEAEMSAALDAAAVAVGMEKLRRSGEVELTDVAPLFDGDTAVTYRPAPGSWLEKLTDRVSLS